MSKLGTQLREEVEQVCKRLNIIISKSGFLSSGGSERASYYSMFLKVLFGAYLDPSYL